MVGEVSSPCLALFALALWFSTSFVSVLGHIGEQPLSKIAIHKATPAFHDSASISASPVLLGLKVRALLSPNLMIMNDFVTLLLYLVVANPLFNLVSGRLCLILYSAT